MYRYFNFEQLLIQVSHIPTGCKRLMLFVLPIVNPYGISRTQQNGIPSGCAIGKIENTRKQHPIGMHRNLRNLNYFYIVILRETTRFGNNYLTRFAKNTYLCKFILSFSK